MTENTYDLLIVGAGCTGYAAAMYAGRLELKTLLVGESPGGLITWTDTVENYPGFIHLTGQELADKLKAHAKEYKIEMKTDRVEKIERAPDKTFAIQTLESAYRAKSVLVATGTKVKELPVPGSKEFHSKGVQYCALCDGFLFKDKRVAVVGGGDSAVKEAIVLANYAKEVLLIYRGDAIRPEPSNRDRLADLKNVRVVLNTNVAEIKGEKLVKSLVLDKPLDGKTEIPMDAVFIAIGHIPLSDLVKPLGVALDSHGYIKIDRESATNVPGVFAAGDVVDTKFKQAIVGVGEAVVGVYSAFNYVGSMKKK